MDGGTEYEVISGSTHLEQNETKSNPSIKQESYIESTHNTDRPGNKQDTYKSYIHDFLRYKPELLAEKTIGNCSQKRSFTLPPSFTDKAVPTANNLHNEEVL
jgi:hypothetical protein